MFSGFRRSRRVVTMAMLREVDIDKAEDKDMEKVEEAPPLF